MMQIKMIHHGISEFLRTHQGEEELTREKVAKKHPMQGK